MSLPRLSLAELQFDWLAGARARLFRLVRVHQRRNILELGAGWGQVADELATRSRASVLSLDRDRHALTTWLSSSAPGSTSRQAIVADAHHIPLADGSCDLVVTQCAFLWFSRPPVVMSEITRVLSPGGAAALLEPDYGGLMESPPTTTSRELWLAAISKAGGHPCIGRRIPELCQSAGLEVTATLLLDRVFPPSPERFQFLRELTLSPDQQDRLDAIALASRESGNRAVAHLPFWMVVAEKSSH